MTQSGRSRNDTATKPQRQQIIHKITLNSATTTFKNILEDHGVHAYLDDGIIKFMEDYLKQTEPVRLKIRELQQKADHSAENGFKNLHSLLKDRKNELERCLELIQRTAEESAASTLPKNNIQPPRIYDSTQTMHPTAPSVPRTSSQDKHGNILSQTLVDARGSTRGAERERRPGEKALGVLAPLDLPLSSINEGYLVSGSCLQPAREPLPEPPSHQGCIGTRPGGEDGYAAGRDDSCAPITSEQPGMGLGDALANEHRIFEGASPHQELSTGRKDPRPPQQQFSPRSRPQAVMSHASSSCHANPTRSASNPGGPDIAQPGSSTGTKQSRATTGAIEVLTRYAPPQAHSVSRPGDAPPGEMRVETLVRKWITPNPVFSNMPRKDSQIAEKLGEYVSPYLMKGTFG